MIRFCGIMISLFALIFVGCWQVIQREGSYQPAAMEIILPDESCPAPCWYGIRAGTTQLMDIHSRVNEFSGVQEIGKNTWQLTRDVQVSLNPDNGDLFIYPQGVTLGDFLLRLGEPDYLTLQFSVGARQVESEKVLQVYYEEAQITLFVPVTERLSVQTPVQSIRYATFTRPFNAMAWQGCVPLAALPSPFETGQK